MYARDFRIITASQILQFIVCIGCHFIGGWPLGCVEMDANWATPHVLVVAFLLLFLNFAAQQYCSPPKPKQR